jgi:putative transposase
MSGDQYKISDQHSCYFLTITVVQWIDVFTRKSYKDIIVDSLNYCVEHKGLELYAWVIMSNHIHLVARVNKPNRMSDFLRDFKKFTSKQILGCIQSIPESRREWLLDKFSFEARKTGRAENYKLWKDSNHALDLQSYAIDIFEKINYIHENPVKAGLVREPEHYICSSAIDYAGEQGLVKVVIV